MVLPFNTSEYINRQERLFAKLPESSVLIIPTNDRKFRSNDVGYPYRGNSYMLYLCGWEEEEGIFVANNTSGSWKTSLFVPPRDTKKEIWEGIRIGVDGATSWPVNATDSIESVESYISEKISDSQNIFAILGVSRIIDEMLINRDDISDPKGILDSMRRIKSSREIEHMQEAARIGSEAHIHAMEITFPGIGEWQIQSVIEAHFTASKSCCSYSSIVGGGDNATILHYNSNDNEISDGELVLVDAGCEVSGYASDITRTWPVNGKFSDQQREIYELVLKAQLAAIEACQAGSVWLSMHRATSAVLAQGMIDLGILDCSLEVAIGDDMEFNGPYRNFFMHGTGHFLGLDVHDVGGGRQGDKDEGRILQPGMVVTVEPGLYFGSWRTDVEIPERYAGIGVRIEDNVLITVDGPVVLSSSCPKTIDEIEALVGNDG